MMKSLLIPLAVISAAVALALYAMPRTYQDFTPTKPTESTPTTIPTDSTARITGRLTWRGAISQIPPIEGMIGQVGSGPKWDKVPNPAAPQIQVENNGIANAVVYLKRVGSARKPWPYPPVTIKLIDGKILLSQGDEERSIGFIPLGGEVEIVSRELHYQMLRARGASFFTLPLPKPNQTEKRTFDRIGHVSFISAIGAIGSEAGAFVCDHPYYTLTDSNGGYVLGNVPPGEYEIVAWLKNWNILSKDRDPETGKIMRLNFDKPFTTTGRVKVVEGQTANVELSLP